jgi:hypothetical protein
MAKAGGRPSTDEEIWFNDAVTLLVEVSGETTDYAEQLLIKGLEDNCVPWSHVEAGTRVKGDVAFWRQRQVDPFLKINRAENSASYMAPMAPMPEAKPSDVPSTVRDIKVSRTAALALLPGQRKKRERLKGHLGGRPSLTTAEVEPEPPIHARPGPKPYDWELYKAKFYLMLDDDDVAAHAKINVSDYADRLMTWGRNNFGKKKTPEQAAMRAKIGEWKSLWERLKNANK